MSRKRVRLSNRRQRAVISDTLPFEVPASFSNRHFCDVLVRFDVCLEGATIRWECADDALDVLIRLFTGVADTEPVQLQSVTQFGRTRQIRRLPILSHNLITMPFSFEICHKANEARRLTVPHPLNQLAVAEFYNDHSALITHFSGLSPFSIRRPSTVSRYSNFKDRLHERLLDKASGQIEEGGKEYDQIGSFFSYESYSNIFKFFESRQYHRAEKRFNAMAKIDISRCFDSIYTHSLPWAIHGNRAIKDNLVSSKSTFAGQFDALMQHLNQNETNGIVIGPEFSRIFAEMILQSVDVSLERRLHSKGLIHRHDYEIFRYVDDFYIFYNKAEDAAIILDNARHLLGTVKLSINPDKTKVYEKPIITEITIAKNAISRLLIDQIQVEAGDGARLTPEQATDEVPANKFICKSNSQSLIIEYKTVLKMSNVSYLDVGNYTFALLESTIDRIFAEYIKTYDENRSDHILVKAIIDVMEFAFFIYASAPRVNISIRITRSITVITKSLRRLRVAVEQRHLFFKFVYDNASYQLKKNRTLEFKEVENLYLFVALGEIGKEYWLEESVIRQHLHIKANDKGDYECVNPLGYFTITVILLYLKNKKKYDKLRHFIIDYSIIKIESRKHYRHKDTEIVMLALDLLACPYVDGPSKQRISDAYDLSATDVSKIHGVSKNWFTTWDGTTVVDELDAKRRREVY